MTPAAVVADLLALGITEERICRHLRGLLPPPPAMADVLRRQVYSPIPTTRSDAIVELSEALARAKAEENYAWGDQDTISECEAALAELYRLDRADL